MQKIEIPFQDLGINTEVDDDQNPGYTRQERTNFINGKVEKIKGLANQQLSGINMDPDIVKFWKYYFLLSVFSFIFHTLIDTKIFNFDFETYPIYWIPFILIKNLFSAVRMNPNQR